MEARAAEAIQSNPEKFAHYIVAEAGGRVTNMDGDPFMSRGGHVLATNGHLHPAMLAIIRKFREKRGIVD